MTLVGAFCTTAAEGISGAILLKGAVVNVRDCCEQAALKWDAMAEREFSVDLARAVRKKREPAVES